MNKKPRIDSSLEQRLQEITIETPVPVLIQVSPYGNPLIQLSEYFKEMQLPPPLQRSRDLVSCMLTRGFIHHLADQSFVNYISLDNWTEEHQRK